MQFIRERIIGSKVIRFIGKAGLSILLLFVILHSLFLNGLRPYQNNRDYQYQNDISMESAVPVSGTMVSQKFIAKGSRLNQLSLYFTESQGKNIKVILSDADGIVIGETEFCTDEFTEHSWNEIGLSSDRLKRDQEYRVTFISEEVLDFMRIDPGEAPPIFGSCWSDSFEINGTLAIGLQFTYLYFTLGSLFELAINVLFSLLLAGALCYAIFKVEELWNVFKTSGKKEGLSYAVFFAVITAMAYNPMSPERNQVTEFGRIIGAGILSDVDVSRRTANFNRWFLLFGITFIGFYLLCNVWHQKKKSQEAEKMQLFLDRFMVLANCGLLIRCIAYFQEELGGAAVFHFSEYVMLLVIGVSLAYMFLRLDRCLSSERFGMLCLMGASLSYPFMVSIALEWGSGRVLLGVLFFCAATILLLIRLGRRSFLGSQGFNAVLYAGVLVLPFAPLMTSVYIELIHVMNQWGVFVAHPAKYYRIAFFGGIAVWLITGRIFYRKKITVSFWKQVAFPVFLFGIACLANQIPISISANPDIFEGANSGILISDFLNFGVIPNVEHYGGHMMTGVWEGILYGIINRDFTSAFVSPYSSLLVPVLCVLFYCLVKRIWNDTIAFFSVLLFPFYSFWSYYGLGMLVCLAVMAYIRKHTYGRAALMWGAFIWCAFYRLDLGFAYGVALVFSMTVYCFTEKDRIAAKQLGITLAVWTFLGTIVWCFLCIGKGIHPISRLLEFLMVNLSNQNWGRAGIGDMSVTLFCWAYIVVPFSVIVALVYVVFSRELKERIGLEKWVLLQLFGWCYFGNFSRGLVRHSLAETATTVVIWCGYLFLAMVFCCYRKNGKIFFPSFFILILCNTVFVSSSNFAQRPILDSAATRPASIVESWKLGRFDKEKAAAKDGSSEKVPLTFWEQVQKNREIVQRVKLNENLQEYAGKYEMADKLLEEGETFVDFINKTLLYCILEKRCPVYISQSPLQLSGEWMQEAFIEEIEGIPIVLMPAETDYRNSQTLDGITNAYRYYKVSEYLYQNYVPLYKYGTDYTVWCLPEKYETYRETLTGDISCTEYVHSLLTSESIQPRNAEISAENGLPVLTYVQKDPMLLDLQNMIDLSPFVGKELVIAIEYKTDTSGTMQLFYTTEPDEAFSEEKSERVDISGSGKAVLMVPVTKDTRLRLDTPERSRVTISSFVVRTVGEFVSYGYDGPFERINADGSVSYSYAGSNHSHNLNHLPRIWAERDRKKANDNRVLQELIAQNGLYVFDGNRVDRENGNYLKITASYHGTDQDGFYEKDDESTGGTVIFGEYRNGQFREKYRYGLTFKEGSHDYLIRCSTDYFWYHGAINAVRLQTDGKVYNTALYLLEGD